MEPSTDEARFSLRHGVFEDAPLGVAAARRAGMRCVVLTTTLPAEAFEGYHNVIASVRDYEELEALWKTNAPW